MVQARPNSGTRIRPLDEWNLLDPQLIGWRATGPQAPDQARDLAQISVALEPLIARLAAERTADIDPFTRERLAESAALMTDAVKAEDPERFAEADMQFHTLLAGASGNAALEYLAGLLHGQLMDHGIGLCQAKEDCAAAHAALAHDVLDGEAKYAESIARDTIALHRAIPGQHPNGSVHATGDEGGEP
jgi:DNA-binding FadR family transcriptional regulator